MDMNISKYMAFVTSVEYGSFTKAAEILNYSQSAISRMINDIEGEWGVSAKGMTTRQISDIIEDIYGFEVSESMVTAVTNKILPQIEEWQQRPLSAVYSSSGAKHLKICCGKRQKSIC